MVGRLRHQRLQCGRGRRIDYRGPRPRSTRCQRSQQEILHRLQTPRARYARDLKYPQWVTNVVMVKKKNVKCRMCVDFTDLNKAFPKDSFPLPHIDQLIDAAAGHEFLSFLDAYSGYNQILMEEADQEKTTFITRQGTYYYRVMPFGLKNAGKHTRDW
uniref:RNA-directed DNA polymerase homolog n=1 Tax=Nicotiana tabacum TaxID=4097 RepID=A0A1S4CQ97_TOBAC|nr:PREDICTED: RNA-directed DNA polymerase homolog [Nicotiana tabacum]